MSSPSSERMPDVPKDVMAFEFSKDRKLAHFVLRLRNVPGALEKSSALLSKSGANILSGFHHAPSGTEDAVWSFFADFTNAKVEPARAAKELRSLSSTISVDYELSNGGLLIDGFHFPLRLGGQPSVMFRADVLGAVFARVNEILGYGAAAGVILYEMGEAGGRRIYEGFSRAIGGGDMFEKSLSYILRMYSSAGWGVFRLREIDMEKKTATVRVFGNFECGYYKSSEPKGLRNHFVRGHLAGGLSQLFGSRVRVEEVRCIAKGDEYCEFTAKPLV